MLCISKQRILPLYSQTTQKDYILLKVLTSTLSVWDTLASDRKRFGLPEPEKTPDQLLGGRTVRSPMTLDVRPRGSVKLKGLFIRSKTILLL